MRKFKFLSMAAIAAMMLGACSDDKISDGPDAPSGPTDNGEGVYFALNVDLPNARNSRSQTTDPGDNGSTSSSGVEIGKDYENAVNEAIVVLASAPDNNFIAAAPVNSGNLNAIGANKTSYLAKSKFSKAELASYYSSITVAEGQKTLSANIFIFCNPTSELSDFIFGNGTATAPVQGKNEWINGIGEITAKSNIWSKNSFLMSNALIATREIPATIKQWNVFTDESNPFKLSDNNTLGDNTTVDNKTNRGAIKVERVAARFDFRDASKGNFTYNVIYVKKDDAVTETPLVNVQLQKMSLVNVNNKFYYLPHMANPTNAEGTSIMGLTPANLLAGVCLPETKWLIDAGGEIVSPFGNYVVDADYMWKNDVFNAWKPGSTGSTGVEGEGVTTAPETKFNEHFLYPFFNNDGTIDNNNATNDRWATSLCADVIKGELNTPDGWNAEEDNPKDYKIWRYATENTIPTVAGQINGVSTGVVFKGKMIAPTPAADADDNTKALAEAINNAKKDGEVLFLFAGNLYCTWESIRQAAITAADPQIEFVKTGESDGKVEGKWVIKEMNRTNSLFKAVFGNGGVGEFKFTYTDKADGQKKEGTTEDIPVDENSANSAYEAWVASESDADLKKFKKAVTDQKIAIYESTYDESTKEYGYYCYYYYWNRHNDNEFNGIMGPMEFGVVRNNVYKLAVTKINRLGHPIISENDPEKPGPGTPDEDESVYIDVKSEVLPWVVRVNNIEF